MKTSTSNLRLAGPAAIGRRQALVNSALPARLPSVKNQLIIVFSMLAGGVHAPTAGGDHHPAAARPTAEYMVGVAPAVENYDLPPPEGGGVIIYRIRDLTGLNNF